MCTLMAAQSSLDSALYDIGQSMDQLVRSSLTELSPASCGVVLLAGLLTSLSPCTLSVLPLTIGYIGGYADSYDSSSMNSSSTSTATVGLQALCFSLGLASSLAGLGVVSSLAGHAYGQIGPGLPTAVALLAVLMGLNLLEVVVVPLPSLNVDVRATRLPPPLVAFLAGATFALAASPCSTPVLASLLAFVSASQQPLQGGVLLLLYSCGYVAPLLVAASATGAAKQLLSVRQYSAWVTPASGVLLVAGGTYSLLTRLLPAV